MSTRPLANRAPHTIDYNPAHALWRSWIGIYEGRMGGPLETWRHLLTESDYRKWVHPRAPWGNQALHLRTVNEGQLSIGLRYRSRHWSVNRNDDLFTLYEDGTFRIQHMVGNGHQLNILASTTFLGGNSSGSGYILYIEPSMNGYSWHPNDDYKDGRPYWRWYHVQRRYAAMRLSWEGYGNGRAGWVMRPSSDSDDGFADELEYEYKNARRNYRRRAKRDDVEMFIEKAPPTIESVTYIKQHLKVIDGFAAPKMLERT